MSFQPKEQVLRAKVMMSLRMVTQCLLDLQLAKVRRRIGKDRSPTAVGWGRDSDEGVGKTSEEGEEEKQKSD